MDRRDYWEECLAQSCEEHGVTISAEQLKAVARDLDGANENIGMAFYSPPPGEHLRMENDRLGRELKAEREKIGCVPCGGTGRLQYNSGPWAVNTQCDKCHGEGKHAP